MEARGDDGCDDSGGDARVHGHRITFTRVFNTAMGCAPAPQTLGAAFEAGLVAVDHAERHGDTLVLTGVGAALTFTTLTP